MRCPVTGLVLITLQNICCDSSLEQLQQDNSNEGPQHYVLGLIKKIDLKAEL